jgi:hypothetical protein
MILDTQDTALQENEADEMQLPLHEKARKLELVSGKGVVRLKPLPGELAFLTHIGAASAYDGDLGLPRDLRECAPSSHARTPRNATASTRELNLHAMAGMKVTPALIRRPLQRQRQPPHWSDHCPDRP